MAGRPSAKWIGVINFPEIDLTLDCRFFTSESRGRLPLPLVLVHKNCDTRIGSIGPSEAEEQGEAAAWPMRGALTQIAQTVNCPSCNRPVPPGEVGHAVEDSTLGLVKISEDEIAALKVGPAKEVKACLVVGASDLLASRGMGRRLWILPKANSVVQYYFLYYVLLESGRCGFIKEIVVDKRPYALVIQPFNSDPALFGKLFGVLVADEFKDTDRIKDPRDIQMLPVSEPELDTDALKAAIAKANLIQSTIDPRACINPERRRFLELVDRKIAEARQKRG